MDLKKEAKGSQEKQLKFKPLTLHTYDGKSLPNQHIY